MAKKKRLGVFAAQVHYERVLAQAGLEPIKPLPAERLTPGLERSHKLYRPTELRNEQRPLRQRSAARPYVVEVLLRH